MSGNFRSGPYRRRCTRTDMYPVDWAAWFAVAGVKIGNSRRGLTFDSYTFAVDAAVKGEGVALGRTTLVADDLAAGRLVRPFKPALKGVSSFYLRVSAGCDTAAQGPPVSRLDFRRAGTNSILMRTPRQD